MDREPNAPQRPHASASAASSDREGPAEAAPGPHSPPPATSDRGGPQSGGYEEGQRDRTRSNRKGGYGAG
ncbi:hypothetical protein [Methylobacterium nigriterrae]|uniref:hypothetical protein n=1 Tax=Methylobacterium nigriterrae TaxID=3127512 RepID=UPI0030133A50